MAKFSYNQGNYPATILQELNKQRKTNSPICDVDLQVNGHNFPAHVCLLVATPFFRDKLMNRTDNNDESQQLSKTVDVNEISSEAMEIVLDFLYTGKITITQNNYYSLFSASLFMKINGLLEFAVDYMIKTLDESNCFNFRDLAYRHDLYLLILKANDFLVDHIISLSKKRCYLELECADLRNLLENDHLNVPSEDVAFDLLLQWLEGDHKNRSNYFLSLFKLIRLHFVSLKYLNEKIATHELVKSCVETRQLVEDALSQHVDSFFSRVQTPRRRYDPVKEQPLGMENGKIPDQAITASSMYDPNHAPHMGRLNNYKSGTGIGAWVVKENRGDFGSPGSNWIQVQLPSKCLVTAIVTQGRPADYNQYVTSYKIKYSNDGENFVDVGQTFTANRDTFTSVENRLPNAVIALFVRLYPMSWQIAPTLRMEILGFSFASTSISMLSLNRTNIERPLGMESNEISDSAITATSMWNSDHAPHLGRLNNKSSNGIGAWVPKLAGTKFSPAGTDWIQVHLPTQCTVTAIITQGRPADYNQYVKSYKIKYSNDGLNFVDVGQTFTGNRDTNSHVTNRLPKPIVASFVRLYPMSWQEAPTLRMEIVGFVDPDQPGPNPKALPIYNPKQARILLLNENKIFIAGNKSWSQLTHIQGLGWIKNGCAIATNLSTVTFCGGLLGGNRKKEQLHPIGDSVADAFVRQTKNKVSNQVMQFDGKNWKTFSAMSARRYGAVAAYVQNRLFVFGGETRVNTSNTILGSFEEYDGSLWIVKGNLLESRTFASVQAVGSKAYLFGGYSKPTLHEECSERPCVSATSTCEVYNAANHTLSWCSDMNDARAKFGSALLGSKIYAVGGVNERTNVQTMEFLDTSLGADKWTTILLSEIDRYLGETSACRLDDKIYIYSLTSNDVYVYNTVNNHWTTDFQSPPMSGQLVTVLR